MRLTSWILSSYSAAALRDFRTLFGRDIAAVIGAVHVPALPGTPKHSQSLTKIIDHACDDAEKYLKHEMDGLIIENTHDIPYVKRDKLTPETTASMTRVCAEIRRRFPRIPLGVQILAGGNLEAMAVAHACDLDFIRAEGFVFSAIADEGFMDACAGELLRFRKNIGAEKVKIFADVKKKHSSHAITADLTVQDVAHAAEFFAADGVIITGKSTGQAADPQEAADAMKTSHLPVLLGSGVTRDNLHAFANHCHGMIVGSDFKEGGKWYNPVDEQRIRGFMETLKKLRGNMAKQETPSHRKPATSDFI